MIVYLDTSVLVKLFVTEEGSDALREELRVAGVAATSVVAYPEARSALARRRRERRFSAKDHAFAVRELDLAWPSYAVVPLSQEGAHLAGELAERYALRGLDAIHLAAALTLRADASEDVSFRCSDNRLARAAVIQGLDLRTRRPGDD